MLAVTPSNFHFHFRFWRSFQVQFFFFLVLLFVSEHPLTRHWSYVVLVYSVQRKGVMTESRRSIWNNMMLKMEKEKL